MSEREIINLALSIKEQLPEDIVAFLKLAGDTAEKRQQRLYLVGGVVRDLLLERINTDIDMVVEGDAIKLAGEIASALSSLKSKLVTHTRFGTATIKWTNRSVDIVSARAETYARPGALPKVRPGTIKEDLARRDFTINAMAIELNPQHFGELLDPCGGRQDIEKERILVLHEQSFIDDATRIWRAVRYEQRLDFKIDPVTLLLLERDIDMLKSVSGDRIRHELELVLKEEEPEKALRRAGELGVLEKLNPYLKADDWLAERYEAVREKYLTEKPNPNLYLALLCYRLIPQDAEKLINYLHLTKAAAQAVRDTLKIKSRIKELSLPGQAPSVIYNILYGYRPIAYEVNLIASASETAAEHIELYESVLKYVRPALKGEDLKRLGVPKGPKMKDALHRLLEARLNGTVDSKQGEEEMVKGWGK